MMNFKSHVLASLLTAAAAIGSQAQETTVTWTILGNDNDSYRHQFVVKGDLNLDKIGFNLFARQMRPTQAGVVVTELVPGYYTISAPGFGSQADSVVIDLVTPGTFRARSFAPDGVHAILADGTTRPVNYLRTPMTQPLQWHAPVGKDPMPYGDKWYDINERISGSHAGIYDVVPSYKSVTLTGGTSKLPLKPAFRKVSSDIPEYYTITISGDSVIVSAADRKTADLALKSFEALVLNCAPTEIPNVVIADYPDYRYRGFMMDISRNFQTVDNLKKWIDYMAQYRMNTLHLHFIDDEGWRIEIPELPELTEFSGRRGYSPDESEYLWQIYSGDGNPESATGVSNGFYTRDEFIDLLRYAWDRGIYILPEVESPGHARAAVKAMEKRYRDTGDDTYRLIHDGDTSEYTTAQDYHDNVMNPAVPGTYRFLDTVFGSIQDMYRKAGVPLVAIHIGGDEVARGAWDGSNLARRLIKEKGLGDQHGLHGYFVENVAALLAERGIPMSGWQEIAVGYGDDFNRKIAPMTFSINSWTPSNADPEKSVTARALRAGFPVVVSNVNNYYVDLQYSGHPEEPGLNWGGYVDEFKSLNGYPAQMCPLDPAQEPGDIIGVSAQLFSETIRSPQMVEYYLFPKMLGLVERSWNADSTYTDAEFNAVIADREIPRWQREGRNFHVRQPGIKVIDGRVYMNSPYPDAVIRYTTDGSEPTASSPVYSAPFSAAGLKDIRARLYVGDKASVTSILFQ